MHENYSSIINIVNKGIDPGFSKGLSLDRGESLKRGSGGCSPWKLRIECFINIAIKSYTCMIFSIFNYQLTK